MELKIEKFDFTRMHREELHLFNDHVLDIVTPVCDPTCIPFVAFKEAASDYAQALTTQGLQARINLSKCDKSTEESWSGMNYQIKASLLHPNPQVRAAAEKVYEIFRKTKSPLKMKYSKAYGALLTLTSQIKTLPRETLELCGVHEFFDALDANVQAFIEAAHVANETKTNQKTGLARENVTVCRKAWLNLAQYLETMALTESIVGIENVINRLNVLIDRVKADIEAHKKKSDDEDDKAKKKKAAEEAEAKKAEEAAGETDEDEDNAVDAVDAPEASDANEA